MLWFFSNFSGIRKPVALDIEDFCEKVFSELRQHPSHDVGVAEIRHFKEKDNMEHEFLLVDIARDRGKAQWTLRLERTAEHHLSNSFFKRLTQVSSSVLPAKDTVLIASSDTLLIDGMGRGPTFPVATLRFSNKPFSLRELCLILSFFPAFSPEYKLREEQCYWFCDVVLSTAVVADEGASIVEEKDFDKAGRFGRFSVTRNESTRQRFIDAYKAIRTLGESSKSKARSSEHPPLEALPTLLAILDVSSTEAKTRALDTITTLANSSALHRARLVDSQAVPKIFSVITSSPTITTSPGKAAIQALVGESWPECLDGESMDLKTAYFSLASPDPNISAEAVHRHMTCLLHSNCPESVLLTFLQSSSTSPIQLSAATAIESHLEQVKPNAIPSWIVALSNGLSSPSYSPRMKRQMANSLVTLIRRETPTKETLLQADINGMLTSESKELKTLILDTLYGSLDKSFGSKSFPKHLLSTHCLPSLEQLAVADNHSFKRLSIFSHVCRQLEGIHPYDPRLPGYLIQWLKKGGRGPRSNALYIILTLAASERFSEDICGKGAPKVLTGIKDAVRGPTVAKTLCALSRWRSCRAVLSDAGLIPSSDDSHNGPISLEVATAHLKKRFSGWAWS